MRSDSIVASLVRQLPESDALTSDCELLARYARHGDEAAFTAIVHRHGGLVLGVARRQLADSARADDVFQATFLALARSASRLRKNLSLANWLYTVALRQSRKARVSAARRIAYESKTPVPESPDPLSAITGRELVQQIDDEVERLPENLRLPLLLCGVQGLSRDEAGRQLGWSDSTVRGRLERARRLLASRLAKRGISISALLLSPAVVPSALLARTASIANASNLPPEVLSLAATNLKVKTWPAIGLACSLLVAGISTFLLAQTQRPAQANAPPPVAKNLVEPDPLDDPLPDGSTMRFGTARFRHGTDINAMAVSPDGRIAVVTSGSHWLGSTRAFDLTTGRIIYSIGKRFHELDGIAISPDGKILASKSLSQIDLWDVQTGKEIRKLPRQKNNGGTITTWLRFSPDGKHLAMTAFDGNTIELIDVEEGGIVRTFPHTSTVFAGAFSSDGKWLAAGGYDSDEKGYFIRIWDVATAKELRRIVIGQAGIRAMAFAPNSSLLATGGDEGRMRIWDATTGKESRAFAKDGGRIRSIAFSPDGKTVVAAGASIRAYDPESGTERFAINRKANTVHFTADGKTLVTAIAGAIHRWGATDGRPLTPQDASNSGIDQIVASPNGKVLFTRDQAGDLYIWDAVTAKLLRRLTATYQRGFAISPDGKYLVWSIPDESVKYPDPVHKTWTHTGNAIRLYDWQADKFIDRFKPFPGDAHDLSFTADGKFLVAVDHNGGRVRSWNVASGKLERESSLVREDEKQVMHFVRKSALSPDGKLLAVGYNRTDNTTALVGAVAVRLWDLTTGNERHDLAGHWNNVDDLAFSPDGRFLVSSADHNGGFGGTQSVFIWDTATGKRIAELPQGLPLMAGQTAFSPDGRLLATASADGGIAVWEVASWTKRQEFRGHRDRISALAFSPDGRLFSGGLDATVLAWNLRPTKPAKVATVASAWDDLASAEAERGFRAQATFLAEPADSIAHFRQHIEKAKAVDPNRLKQLAGQLDDPKFAVRERATRELQQMGQAAAGVLRDIAENSGSDEASRRAKTLLDELKKTALPPEVRRALRAIEVLEWVGTAEAKKVLEEWAGGERSARLTVAAEQAVKRLNAK